MSERWRNITRKIDSYFINLIKYDKMRRQPRQPQRTNTPTPTIVVQYVHIPRSPPVSPVNSPR